MDTELVQRRNSERSATKAPGFRLTERDVQILKFVYEQKFATLELLYFRFFDRRKLSSDPIPENTWVTRQRISVLRRAGFLSSQRVYTDSKAVYLLTGLGYQVLKSKRELLYYSEPVQQVDFRYFEHDRRVSYCRTVFERSEKCLQWFPERYLRSNRGFEVGDKRYLVPGDAIPDGVFLSSKEERIAFELEFTPKKRERYEEKCRRYLSFMHGIDRHGRGGLNESVFQRVVIVACTDRIGKDLQELFNHPGISVLSFEKLVGGTLGAGALGV
jgi:hypothetical protein